MELLRFKVILEAVLTILEVACHLIVARAELWQRLKISCALFKVLKAAGNGGKTMDRKRPVPCISSPAFRGV
jgi:hypothetical protein